YSQARFSVDGKSIYVTCDEGSEFSKLVKINLGTGKKTDVTHEKWDVDSYEIAQDGKTLAYETNENGVSVLHALTLATMKPIALPKLPAGSVGGIEWHPNGHVLGFTLTSAKSPSDAYSIDIT